MLPRRRGGLERSSKCADPIASHWHNPTRFSAVLRVKLLGAHHDTTTRPEEVFSLSSSRAGELGRGGGRNFWWLYQDAPNCLEPGNFALTVLRGNCVIQ